MRIGGFRHPLPLLLHPRLEILLKRNKNNSRILVEGSWRKDPGGRIARSKRERQTDREDGLEELW